MAYKKFLSEQVCEETVDPDWNLNNHPAVPILARFEPCFSAWASHMIELNYLRLAGYPLTKNDISYVEWKCLAVVNQWHQAKTEVGRKVTL